VRAASGAPAKRRSNIRERIDAVDAQLHALINERARLAQQVGISKHAAGHTVDFYRPEREAQVLRWRSSAISESGPLRDEEDPALFREIMSACLAQQRAEDRLSRPGRHVHAAGGAEVFRPFGPAIAASRRSKRCSTRWNPARPIWRRPDRETRPKAPSTTRSTCFSRRR
jgi:chorismate mutase-like protein